MLEGLSRIYDLTSPYASEAKSNEDGSILILGHMGLCSEPDDPPWDLLGMTKAPALPRLRTEKQKDSFCAPPRYDKRTCM